MQQNYRVCYQSVIKTFLLGFLRKLENPRNVYVCVSLFPFENKNLSIAQFEIHLFFV